MAQEVIEVVARFGDTILDVTHLSPSDTYRIGTAPGCAVAAPGLTCFPLVDADTVRWPVGFATYHQGATSELRVGALTFQVSRTRLPAVALPRPRPELRTPVVIVASLIAHLAVWLAAARFAPLERLGERPRVRLARLVETPVLPPPPPKLARTRQQPPARDAQPAGVRRVGRGRAHAARGYAQVMPSVGDALARVMKSFDDTHVVERVSALTAEGQYDEEAANAQGFGGGRRFDPTQREGWGTIESGAYATISFDFKQCPKGSACEVVGPIPPLHVRTHLLARMAEIYDCYQTHASGPGTIVLEFTITGDGAVRDARGSGLGETGACAARVVGEILFRALDGETRVRWPVVFKS